MTRIDGRQNDQLRDVQIVRHFTNSAPGSVLYKSGETTVLCTASVSESVPEWMAGRGKGWITAEYNMLPGSTSPRKSRDRLKVDGRTTEIQRLIGRSFRAVVDLQALGEYTITLDCDVLQADGGTRTASITGAIIALLDALATIGDWPSGKFPVSQSVAAVSVGVVDGVPMLDLNYAEDAAASVDMNVVMTGDGRFIELQGTGEEATFSKGELDKLLTLASGGVQRLIQVQRDSLGIGWPFDK